MMTAAIIWMFEILLSFLVFLLRPDFCENWDFVLGIVWACALWIPALYFAWCVDGW